jgi:hypothetical protein
MQGQNMHRQSFEDAALVFRIEQASSQSMAEQPNSVWLHAYRITAAVLISTGVVSQHSMRWC